MFAQNSKTGAEQYWLFERMIGGGTIGVLLNQRSVIKTAKQTAGTKSWTFFHSRGQ